jgi:SH3-like domain-containing protein
MKTGAKTGAKAGATAGRTHAKTTHAAAARVPVVTPRHGDLPPRRPPPPAPAKRGATHKITAPAPKPAPPAAPPTPAPATTDAEKLPVPRYASLKTDDVNMRVGPGERYQVTWNYKRRELPVRIERDYQLWRLVEDMDGIKGWVNQATLTGRRTFVITGTMDRTMRSDASDTADAVAVLKPGVVGRIRSCEAGKDWCQVQVQDYRGWLKRSDMWGVDSGEPVGQ